MARIEHVVVLMLENRSFDCMLGRLYPDRADFDGLRGDEWNPWHRPDGGVERIGVWNDHTMSAEAVSIPDPDPGELFSDITRQIFGLEGRPGQVPRMAGFVDDYMRQPGGGRRDPRAVMHGFTPEQLPVLSELARRFAVCDRWFASAPCQTWPNRLFAHTGSGAGHVNNGTVPLPFFLPTVFNRLGRRGRSWRVYFHDMPQTAALADLWLHIPTHFRLFDSEFADDARNGQLPNYSFIEPRYFPSRLLNCIPNDAHPPHNVAYAEQLIADTYNALRAGPGWERTLFIVTVDEHGGCYDHVPPPPAVPPDPRRHQGFGFDRYGVRVPAVIVSPWVAAGSVARPRGETPFDHASIIATLGRLFDLGTPLSNRVAVAPDLLQVLTLDGPDNPGPERIEPTRAEVTREEVRHVSRQDRNAHQRKLRHPAMLIPGLTAMAAARAHRAGRRRKRGGTPR